MTSRIACLDGRETHRDSLSCQSESGDSQLLCRYHFNHDNGEVQTVEHLEAKELVASHFIIIPT